MPPGVRWQVGGGFVREQGLPGVEPLDARQGDVVVFGPPLWHHALFIDGPDDAGRLLTVDGNAGVRGCVRTCRRPLTKLTAIYSIRPWCEAALEREAERT